MNGDSRDMPGHRPAVDPSTTDTERLARERVTAMLRHRRVCAQLERLAPLSAYCSRPLRALPLAEVLAEGRWTT
jgi:hypothetical protein